LIPKISLKITINFGRTIHTNQKAKEEKKKKICLDGIRIPISVVVGDDEICGGGRQRMAKRVGIQCS